MTEAEVFSLSITNQKGGRTGAFDWLADQTGSEQGALQICFKRLCSISTVNDLFSALRNRQ